MGERAVAPPLNQARQWCSGYYAFKTCVSNLLMLGVTMYLYHKWYTKKQKLKIYGWFLNELQDIKSVKLLVMLNKFTTGYFGGYHAFLLQVVCQKQTPQIDGSFLNLLYI